jgi:hypothetical protein
VIQVDHLAGSGRVVPAQCLDRAPYRRAANRGDERGSRVEGVLGEDEVVVLPGDRDEAQVQRGGCGADTQSGIDDACRDGQRDLQVGADLGPAEGVGVESGVEEQAVEEDTGSGARGSPCHSPPSHFADRGRPVAVGWDQ